MLFSMQRLTALGYPGRPLDAADCGGNLCAMQHEMRAKYRVRQLSILDRLAALEQPALHDPAHWWQRSDDLAVARARFDAFAGNIEHNFGAASPCQARLDDPARRADWRARQCAAITGLPASRQQWAKALQMLQASAMTQAQADAIQDVLDYWFSPRLSRHWFASTPALDDEIRLRYEALWQRAASGELDAWSDTPDGALALAIVLDQLPLNMYRGLPLAFSTEQLAVAVARQAVARGDDQRLPRDRVMFLYMPLMHSENLADQDQSVALFQRAGLTENLRFAEHHRGIVRRFGRFPHRNAILGRESTAAERVYLASPEAFKG
jgi:uncharacterized protein (DUF924 family)